MWKQTTISVPAKKRGIHLITNVVVDHLPELLQYQIGILHLFIQHTSASITINENADPDVRHDLELWLNKVAPENEPSFKHTFEGSDDMPAHLKSIMIGPSLSIPIQQGRLALGSWQGIYLCEHRNHGGSRRLVATLQGQII